LRSAGAFVAAMTAGKLLKRDAGQMQNALGIAGSMAVALGTGFGMMHDDLD
jgi:hypothetical protein